MPPPRESPSAFREIARYVDPDAGRFRTLAFGLGGGALAAGATDGRVLLFDLSGAPSVRVIKGDSFSVNCLASAPDRALAVAGRDGVTLLDARSGARSRPTPAFTGDLSVIAYSPDGALVATGGSDGSVYLRFTSGEQLPPPRPHFAPITALAFSLDSSLLLIGSHAETSIYDVKSVQELRHADFPTKAGLFTPDGRHLALGSERGSLLLIDVETLEEVRTFKRDDDGVWSVALSPGGKLLACGTEHGSLALWSLETGEALQRLVGHEDAVLSLAFDPVRPLLASGGRDSSIILWSVEDPPTPLFPAPGTVAGAGEGEPDEGGAASGGADAGGAVKALVGHEARVSAMAVSPRGDRVASADERGHIRVWDVHSGDNVSSFEAHDGPVRALAFSPDGQWLASGGEDGSIQLRDPETGIEDWITREHEGPVMALAWHPLGDIFYSGGQDRAVRIWDHLRQRPAGSLREGLGLITALAVSPDGELLAVGDETEDGSEPTIKLWAPSRGEALGVLHGHRLRANSLAFSPDQGFLLSGSRDGTARLWSMKRRECVLTLPADERGVLAVGFSRDNRGAQFAGVTRLQLWDLSDNSMRYQTREHAGEVATVRHCDSGELVVASAALHLARVQVLDSGVGGGQVNAAFDGGAGNGGAEGS